jgi:hypothetical protein
MQGLSRSTMITYRHTCTAGKLPNETGRGKYTARIISEHDDYSSRYLVSPIGVTQGIIS